MTNGESNESFMSLLTSIPKRLFEVIIKLLSVKGCVFAIATWLYVAGTLPTWGWLCIAGILVFGRDFLKYMKEIKG